MRISDWSSDVCSSDLHGHAALAGIIAAHDAAEPLIGAVEGSEAGGAPPEAVALGAQRAAGVDAGGNQEHAVVIGEGGPLQGGEQRSEEHTSELQSLMRISYAVFCLKKKKHYAQRS